MNADTIATELAINLSASKLIFISDVPYIKDLNGDRISSVNQNVAKKLFDEKIISDGMIVKVENSLKALDQGSKNSYYQRRNRKRFTYRIRNRRRHWYGFSKTIFGLLNFI